MYIRILTTAAIIISVLTGCSASPDALQNANTPAPSSVSASKPPSQTATTAPATAITLTPTATPGNASQCRKEPLAGVYNPQRLEVKEACKTVTGVVDTVRHETDGDYHIALKLDQQYANLINDKNVKDEHGDLVVEIIPLDEPKIPTPKKGQHLTVTGSYVLDKHHGWMEVHPAWIVDSKGSVNYDPKRRR